MPFTTLGGGGARLQATLFHGRERRRSLAGITELFRTHRFSGSSAIAVATIATGTVFPVAQRDRPITFRTSVRMTADGSVATEHRGLVFEFGGALRGTALWIGDQTIGFSSGGGAATDDDALALFDNGTELVAGLEMELVAAIIPGSGRVRLWGNGKELARATSVNGDLGGDWANANDGSFSAATAGGSLHDSVPGVSAIAPDGFEVIEPLSVYVGQAPRHFV